MKLTGKDLLEYFDNNPSLTYNERCTTAGYMINKEDGTQVCDYSSFFEAILDARNDAREDITGSDWYNNLSEQDSELYDAIEDMCPEFTKYTAEQCQEFMDELSEHGITTAEQFNDAYFWQSDSWKAEADFVEYIVTELECAELPPYIVVDWQASWDCNYRHDFFTIEFDGETYFFNNNF